MGILFLKGVSISSLIMLLLTSAVFADSLIATNIDAVWPQDAPVVDHKDQAVVWQNPEQVPAEAGLAASPGPNLVGNSLLGTKNMFQVIFALLVVLALIFFASYIIKRLNGDAQQPNSLLKVISFYPLGPKHKIVLVQVNEIHLLIGMGPDGLNCLHKFSEGEVDSELIAVNRFSQRLQDILSKGVTR